MTVNRPKTSPGKVGRRAGDMCRSVFVLSLFYVVATFFTSLTPAKAGTLLPNGEQVFLDNNGLPIAAGCVFFYVPGTANPKATYQNAAQTVANTNPVQLDAAGRAIIYGTGTYRQVVNASNGTLTPCSPVGVQIWDQLTASTDSSATIFAGASAGTPNAITVTAPGFAGIDGQVINYVSTNTNSGGATFNPSGFGAVQIVRDSATGPGPLTGGELVATNAVSLIYDATAGTFHILSPVTWPNTSGVPVGTIISVGGYTAPTNYAFAYGQAVSRTTFPSLLGAYTFAQTGSISSGSPTITGLSDTSQFGGARPVEALGIQAGATITSCTVSTCTMSLNATLTRSGTITFFAYGNGDGSTTFNLPDLRGMTMAGRENMGGSTRGAISQTYFGTLPTVTGIQSTVGESTTLATTNLPAQTPSGTVATSTSDSDLLLVNGGTTTALAAGVAGYGWTNVPTAKTFGASLNGTFTSSFTGTAFSGQNSTPFSKIQPTAIVNWAVRLTP